MVKARLTLEVAVTAFLTSKLAVAGVVAARLELELAVAGLLRGLAMLEAGGGGPAAVREQTGVAGIGGGQK